MRGASSAAYAPHRRATFDAGNQKRRSMLAKIQIARKDLAMEKDDYRQIVLDQTGRLSLKEASEADLVKVLQVMQAKGFRPLPKSGRKHSAAEHPVAKKARALWISLHHLGVVHNPAEPALEAFAKGRVGCDKLVWMKQSDGYLLIEALKDMARRNGWKQQDIATGKPLTVLQLQRSLCAAIMDKLRAAGAIPADWTLDVAVQRLGGMAPPNQLSIEDYSRAAALLGKKLRECGAATTGDPA